MKARKTADNHKYIAAQKQRKETLFKKEIWYAEEMGIIPSSTHSAYRINFTNVNPLWFRSIVKQFVYFQSATKAFWTLSSYITGLRHFGNFITLHYPDIQPHEIDRPVIVDYINYLCVKSVKIVSRQMALIHLRTFLEIVAQEEWLPFTKARLIYNTDMPKKERQSPRFIPEPVMAQLKDHLPTVPDHYRRLIFILMETGRRISEICTLPYDCMQQDEDGSYFLKVNEHKTKKSYFIPITNDCASVIKEQQAHHLFMKKQIQPYLFVAHNCYSTADHLTARNVHNVLNDLARDKNIRDENGKIWHFHAHQFRHTVGTRMINAGVSQPIVQRYLGHESPEMTSRYAYIHDRTLKNAFFKFQGNLVNIHGDIINHARIRKEEEKWLKHNIMAQALPNGYCGLPAKQQRCPHANACLTCASFRTDETFLPHHERQLKATNEIIDNANKCGWQRQAEMNQEIKINLENIIAALRAKRHEPA